LIDREQGGREQLKKAGYRLHSAFTMQQMLEYYLKKGKLTKGQYEDIKERIELLNQFLVK
jgi:orotate phosphoribosyltransferase